MAASDLSDLGLNSGRETLLGFGRRDLVFRADHTERRPAIIDRWGGKAAGADNPADHSSG